VHLTIDPDEYARRFQDRDVARRSPGRKAARFVAFTLAWMVAIGSGALGARWVDDNGGVEAALRKLMQQPSHAGDAPAQVADAPAKAELPYDGAPPAATQAPLRSAQAIATPGAPAPRPAAKIARHKGTQAAPQEAPQAAATPKPDEQAAAVNEKPADTSSGASEAKSEPDVAPDAQPVPAPSPPTPKAAKPVEKMAEKATTEPPAKTARKKSSSTTQKIARGREINRIQQQAAEELKKKTRKRRARVEQAKKASKSSLYALPQQRHIRQMLARCEKLDGVFWQEQCKWRICDGRWGKNGCPSYTRDKVAAD
jgi:hypothetical protein